MKTVFITGATGFVGSHTARLFQARGWNVRALVRRLDKPGLLPEGVQSVKGTLTDVAAYRDALQGCDAIVHVAGLVKARSLAEYQQANVGGSAAIAGAASEACPSAMFVHVSSQAAAGPARTGIPTEETDPPRPVSWYGQSKLEGEQIIEKTVRGPWCVVRPTVVYGSGDPGVLELFKPIQRGLLPILAGGKTLVQLIDVADLARVLVAAASRPDLSGRRGFAGNDILTTGELMTYLGSLRARPALKIPVPAAAIRLLGFWESMLQRVTGKARPFNRDKAREMLQTAWICNAEPWLRDLGVSNLRPWQEGLKELCRCYVAAGWLQPNVWRV